MTGDGMVPVGELYHSRDLYGDSMVALKEALEEAGFGLDLEPLADRATLVAHPAVLEDEEANDG